TAGAHPLRIDHFDGEFGQALKLEWQPPGADGFTLVPTSALSTDADVTRVTSPGRKECEGVTDTPGDGLPLNDVHPNYTLTNRRPAGSDPRPPGRAGRPEGRLAISAGGGSRDSVLGSAYLIDGLTGNPAPSKVT